MSIQDTIRKGKGNGARKAYNHLVSSNLFGVADRIKEARKSNTKKRNNGRNRKVINLNSRRNLRSLETYLSTLNTKEIGISTKEIPIRMMMESFWTQMRV